MRLRTAALHYGEESRRTGAELAGRSDGSRRESRAARFERWFQTYDPPKLHIERLTFLSDGVFAIALTLLAIEIRPPESWDGRFAGLGHEFVYGCIAYLIGFAILGAIWTQQRRILALLVRVDAWTTALVLACLAAVGLMPAAVSFQIHYSDRLASFVIYGGVFLLLAIASASLWIYVTLIGRLVRDDLPERYRWGEACMMTCNVLALSCAGLAAWVSGRALSGFGAACLVTAVAFAVASGLIRSWTRRAPAGS